MIAVRKFLIVVEAGEIDNVVCLVGSEKEEVKRRFIDSMQYCYDWDDIHIYDVEEIEHNWSYWSGNR